jgi:hypothetical protein
MAAYTTNPQAIHETIDGETIIIDLATGTYYSLQGAASEIWNALGEGESDEGIIARLTATYGGDETEIGSAVNGFLSELEAEGLIASSEGDGSGATARQLAATNGNVAPFVPPKLEKYTDMQDIILLDPVHQVDDRGWPHAAQVESA